MRLQDKPDFQLANRWLINQLFRQADFTDSRILEIGANKIGADYLVERNALHCLTIAVDKQQQFNQLAAYARQGAQLVVAEADNLPFKAESMDFLLVNSLTPCNYFWEEIYRLLAPTGCALFTIPAYGLFQDDYSPEQQAKMLGKENLQVAIKIPVLKSALGADDAQFKHLSDTTSILDAYLIVKRK